MKVHFGLVILLAYAIGFFVLSKTVHADGWNGHPVAFTFSSDDGDSMANMQWTKVFTDRGLRYTAFIVSDWVNNPTLTNKLLTADLVFMHAQGIEIGSHGKTHTSLVDFSTREEVLDELVLSARELEGFIGSPYLCRTFAYPYHEHNPREMALASLVGYTGARNGGQNPNLTWPFVSEGEATWRKTDLFEVFCGIEPGFFMRSEPSDSLYTQSETESEVRRLLAAYGPDSSWINVSAHYVSELDSTHLGWALDELRRNDVWIEAFATVADYYRQEHGLLVPTMVQLPVGGIRPGSEMLPLRAAPNPIGARTVLSFTLDKPGPVRLEIVGIDGRHVATLMSGDRASGPHAVSWHGEDERGQRVAEGVYIARLQAGTLERSLRLILLR